MSCERCVDKPEAKFLVYSDIDSMVVCLECAAIAARLPPDGMGPLTIIPIVEQQLEDDEFLPPPEGNHEKAGQALLKAIDWAIEEIKRKP